jgi:hypothetical protein
MSYEKLWIGILTIGLITSAISADDYAVRFNRPMKVGDKYGVSGFATENVSKKITAGGKVIKEQQSKSKVSIIADITVLNVNKKGMPIAVKCVIKKMELEYDGKQIAGIPKESVVEISIVDKKQICKIKGSEIPPASAKPLNSVIKLAKFDSTDDDIFGTNKRKKVCNKWEIDKKRMIADMAATGLHLNQKNIEGSAKLLKTLKLDDRECILVATEFKLDKLSSPKLPSSLKIKRSNMEVTSSFILPIDNSTPRLASVDSMTIFLVMEGAIKAKAPTMMIEVRNEKKRTLAYKYKQ